MFVALRSNNKLGFIDGYLSRPIGDNCQYLASDKWNMMVMSLDESLHGARNCTRVLCGWTLHLKSEEKKTQR